MIDRLLALLERLLPEGPIRDGIRGDLEEGRRERRTSAGACRADGWAIAQLAYAALLYTPRRLAHRRRSPSRRRLSHLGRDLRYGLRTLRTTPLPSVLAVATIAVGMGMTASVLGIVHGVLIRPLPFPDPSRLVAIDLVAAGSGRPVEFEALDLRDFRAGQTSFAAVEGYFRRTVAVAGSDGYARSLPAGFVTAGALDLLGVRPALGRGFAAGEDFREDIAHVVIGHDLWQRRYGGGRDVLGRRLEIDGRRLEIVGVMPPKFAFPLEEQLWLPMDFRMPSADRGSGRSFAVFGRLAAGVDRARAGADARAAAGRIATEHPEIHPALSADVSPLARRHLPGGLDSLLHVMLAAVICVLLIASANLANLLLARGLARRREVSVRRALGASGGRIGQQFLVESAIVCGAGTALGLAFATTALRLADHRLSTLALGMPYWVDVRVSGPLIWLMVALFGAVTLVAGGVPAIRAATRDPASGLPRAGRGSRAWSVGASGRLVTLQVALASSLLICAGLLVKSVVNVRGAEKGFESDRVLAATVSFPAAPDAADQSSPDQSSRFAELLERIAAVPGVEAASVARGAPGTGPTFSWPFEVRGQGRAGPLPRADGVPIGHGYPTAMGLRVVRGRAFSPEESRAGSEPRLLVNETLARRHLGRDPVGRQIRIGDDGDGPWLTVVGIVADTYIGSATGGIGLSAEPREQMYVSWGVAPYRSGTLLVRSDGDPRRVVSAVRAALADVAPGVPLGSPRVLDDVIDGSTWAFGLFGAAFSVFGFAALLLTISGLYGVLAFSVSQRRAEFGVRMALGADAGRIRRLVLVDAGRRLLWGSAGGTLLAFGLARSIEAALFGVAPSDPSTYLATLGAVIAVGTVAALVPATIAARSNPVATLR